MACILVLSDDRRIQKALQHVLTEVGHTVVAAELFQHTKQVDHPLSPQLVLVDLPGYAHYEDGTISGLRHLYPTAKFVALLNGDNDNVTWLARQWGVDDCLFKPFTLDALLTAVHQWPLPVDPNAAS